MRGLYYWFAVVYTFIVWGFGWGLVSLFVPIFPLIDFVKFIFS